MVIKNSNINSVNEQKDYGKVNILLKNIMDKKNTNIYQMTVATGLSYNTVKLYYKNEPITRLDVDVLAKYCYVLDCDIKDIIKYEKPKG